MAKKQSPIVPVVALLVAQLCVGILYVWSVLKKATIDYYMWEDGAVNLVASFMLFAFCVGNFAGGALNDKIGPKKVCMLGMILFGGGILASSFIPVGAGIIGFYVTYCIIGGIGCGFTYGAVISGIQKWFPHRRGFASGLGTSTFGLATVVFSPIIGKMLGVMTISTTLRILSIVFLVVGLVASLFVKLPSAEYLSTLPIPAPKKTSIDTKDMPLSVAINTLPFWCLFFGIFFYNGTWNLVTPLIKGLGVERGLTEALAITCVSLTGLFNAAGRLIMASLSDKLGRINTMHILSVITAVCALLLIFVGEYAYFVVILVTAFAYGGPAAVNPATSTDFFGPKNSGANYGVIMLALGLSSIVFNAISNAMYAATGAYTLTFIMAALSAVVTIVIFIIINACIKKQKAEAK
ncbi:MAG: MFS transporter [Oscillospiraceae bacterium]|nr:MFS transporter [Oscillospiraceae bacterium]